MFPEDPSSPDRRVFARVRRGRFEFPGGIAWVSLFGDSEGLFGVSIVADAAQTPRDAIVVAMLERQAELAEGAILDALRHAVGLAGFSTPSGWSARVAAELFAQLQGEARIEA